MMRSPLRWLTVPLLAAALAAAGCLTASQESRLQTDMAQVREQVFTMQRDTAAILARLQELEQALEVQGGSSPARYADLEALLRSLTDEVRALGARLDDNTSRMTALSRDVIAAREQYRSLEARLAAALATRGLQPPGPGGGAGPAGPLAADPNQPTIATHRAGLDAAAPGAEGAAVPLDSIAPSPESGVAPEAGTPPALTTADEAAQEASYRNAYNDYTRGTFDSAILGFREFLRRWPTSPLAGRAQYFIGESLFSQQKYDEAAQAFTLTIDNYPGSDKIAAAYLKKGLSLLALKQTARGVMQLQHVIETYPRTEEARIAADQLRQLGLRDY